MKKNQLAFGPRFSAFTVLLLLCFTLLVGCGGGVLGGLGGGLGHTLQINWPDRSRAPLDVPLTSALSAKITIFGGRADGSDYIGVANRDQSKLDAHTSSHTITDKLRTGTATILIDFYSLADGSGSRVGTASITTTLDETQIDLGTVNVSGTIRDINFSDAAFAVNAGPRQLTFSARDSEGALVAVTAGSAIWQQQSGNGAFAVSGSGVLTPASLGSGRVRVTVDGHSAEGTVTITPAGPPAGTARAESGPMLVETGVANASIEGENTLQTFQFRKADGSTETIPNALVFDSLGLNDPVVVLRAGSQPIKGAFTDSSNRFYRTWDHGRKIPVSADGVLQANVIFKRAGATVIASLSPIDLGGLTLHDFSLSQDFTGDQLAVLPKSFSIDLPVPGQPIEKVRGQATYDATFGLHRLFVSAHYSEAGNFSPNNIALGVDGTVAFASPPDGELAQGTCGLHLRLQRP